MKKSIYILDDHSIVSLGISILIEEVAGKCVIECGKSEEDFQNRIQNKVPTDCFILDINIPHFSCLNAIDQIKYLYPEAKIIVLTMNPENLGANHYYKKGVDAYVHKNSSDNTIKLAISKVLMGLKYYSNDYLISKKNDNSDNPFILLSHREFELVELLIRGKNIVEAKELLNLHSSTIHTFKTRIFRKLNVQNQIELIELYKFYYGS